MTIESKGLSLTDAEIAQAKQIWQEYQQTHDVTSMRGWAAGIDPSTGEVWLGEDVGDIVEQRGQLGLTSPLFLERVGFRTYLRKGRLPIKHRS
jgi:hypothetical protein